jgi:hypothetical protein
MNASSVLASTTIQLGIAAIILLSGFIVYTNGFKTITNPTAQQSMDLTSTTKFFVYTGLALAVAVFSIQSKSLSTFFFSLVLLSFVWYIMNGSWQYVPV